MYIYIFRENMYENIIKANAFDWWSFCEVCYHKLASFKIFLKRISIYVNVKRSALSEQKYHPQIRYPKFKVSIASTEYNKLHNISQFLSD